MLNLAKQQLRASLTAIPLSALIGGAVAFFLWSLDFATQSRHENPALIFGLPLAGLAMVAAYRYLGGKSAEGSNLIIDEIHNPDGGVPRRMTPLVLISTAATHLFGGSAGREGTAVQMGGSMASGYSRFLKLPPDLNRTLLMCGISAGFGAVFGTPLAGALFAMEVLHYGKLDYKQSLPCLVAAYSGHLSCIYLGIHHYPYSVSAVTPSVALWLKLIPAALAMGLAARFFVEFLHIGSDTVKRLIQPWWLRPLFGGSAVVALCYVIGSTDYLGLGVNTPGGISIVSSFEPGGANTFSWLWKILFTVLTLSTGFKGGEVTCLFFVGATLGNTLATSLGVPVDLFAALGFVALFASASNTPLASTIMGIELFGAALAPYLALACFVAWIASGKKGIYHAQRTV